MDGMGEEIQNGEGIGRSHCTEVERENTKGEMGLEKVVFESHRVALPSPTLARSISPPLLGPFIGATLPARLRPPI